MLLTKINKLEIMTNNNSNKVENPFKGLKNCLDIYQGSTWSIPAAWEEVKDSLEKRQLFFSLLFSRGDIANRQHKIFGKNKVDTGGSSDREGFWQAFLWLRENLPLQFEEFLKAGLFNEYQCFDTLFRSRVKTTGKPGRVREVYDVFEDDHYREVLADYVASIINGDDEFNKLLVAKFLTIPRLSKRKNHRKMLPETKEVMKHKSAFLVLLSEKLNWDTRYFKGYREWRKRYNQILESVMFSTGRVNDLTKEDYLKWIEKLPAKAHSRVIKRTRNTDKWPNLKDYENEWIEKKTELQAKQRELQQKAEIDPEAAKELEKIKKQAKVNSGAISFEEIYDKTISERMDGIDALQLDDFVENKVNLPVNALVILDDSGSMKGGPFKFGALLATICLYKADENDRNLIGLFGDDSRWYSGINMKSSPANSLVKVKPEVTFPEKLIDPLLGFTENYSRLYSFLKTVYQNGCTYISEIPNGLYLAYQKDPKILDFIKKYPVWIIISDNEWNNLRTPKESIEEFMNKCYEYFGFKPHIVAIDVNLGRRRNDFSSYSKFEGVDNITYIPSNPAMMEMLLTNYNDLESFDAYTPLLSIFKSNRYSLVREKTI